MLAVILCSLLIGAILAIVVQAFTEKHYIVITLRRYTKKVLTAEKGWDLSIAGDGGSLLSRRGSAYWGF